MKRLLVSVLCGFLIPFIYLVVAVPLSTYIENRTLLFLLDLPYGWPRVLYYRYCFPRCSLPDATFFALIVAGNVLLYATLTYFVLWLRALRKPKAHAAPPPPNF